MFIICFIIGDFENRKVLNIVGCWGKKKFVCIILFCIKVYDVDGEY